MSSVIKGQGQTPFPRKKRGQKPRYNKEFQTTRRNTAAQPRLGGDLTKLHCGSQDQAGKMKGPSAWHSDKQRKLKFSNSGKMRTQAETHTHAHEKTRARVRGTAYTHITIIDNRGTAADRRPGAAAPL